MGSNNQFDEAFTLQLRRDEAIVLFNYLSRELYGAADEKNLRASFVHPAEVHGLLALHQELISPMFSLGPQPKGIVDAAREHLLARHT